ncbi:hypothetical protein IV203_028111 [Nitzschia inconspicua]|uniref:Uncharacterized protein n=1 Tax=Nitzschia inconspicua TaxID=303405 RepID=A0A9K3LYY3_9STRA|nr:hypothetical protein IV203_028111 [Nitzschia inconspicua]
MLRISHGVCLPIKGAPSSSHNDKRQAIGSQKVTLCVPTSAKTIMSDDAATSCAAAAAAAAAAATTSDTTPACMDTSSVAVQSDVPVAVAVDANVLWPTPSSSQENPPFTQQPVTNNNNIENASVMTVMMMDPETAVRWDTPTTPVVVAAAPKPSAVAYPIHSNTAATSTQRSNSTGNEHKVCMCSAIVAAVIFVTIVLVLLVGGKTYDDTTTPTTTVYYYDSFEAFCFVVKGFYALEHPWLNCRCDHANYWLHCRGTRPTEDHVPDNTNDTTTTASTNLPDDVTPLTVLRFQYDNMYGMDRTGYTGTSCECKTQSCDPDTTQCFEVGSYDYSSYCRITNNVTWGDSICNVFQVEQDWAGNEYSSFQEACQICGGLPETDESSSSSSSKGYYYFDTSACGSDFDHNTNNNNYCVPSLIPNWDLLFGSMKPASHTPNQQLLNSMQSSKAFCNHITNKYENTVGGYTCSCLLDEEDGNDDITGYDMGDVVNTVECRPVNDTLNYVRWQRQYWPYGVNSMDASYSDGNGYSWGIAPLTYPFLLLGESCHCSEPTCTLSSVMCTALSYNFERYGCSVYDKLNAPNTMETTTNDDGDDDVRTCGSQKCTVCELFPGDDDTGVVRVDTSLCDGQPACRPTDFFL